VKNKNGVWIGLAVLIIIIGFVMAQNRPAPTPQQPVETPAPTQSEPASAEPAATSAEPAVAEPVVISAEPVSEEPAQTAVQAETTSGPVSDDAASADAAPAAQTEAPEFHIGVATLTVSQAEDTYRAAEFLISKYGSVSEGGMIRHVTMPDSFMSEMETTISQIVGLSDDPLVKVIVVDDAIPGTTEAFRRVKEKRPDIICLAGEPQEDPGVIGPVADMAIYVDNIARGYLIINTAKQLGAKNFVHISFPRHMGYELLARRRAIMEEACKELGLNFYFESAPDPTSDVGVSGAQQYILEQVPNWVDKYGKDTAFFCTNDAQTEPLLAQVAKYGAIFVEPDLPSPLMGYPGAFGIDLKDEAGNWPAILKKVEAAVETAGGSGRMGTWAYSYGWSTTCALAEYGKNIVEGTAKLGNLNDLWAAYDVYTPGAKWNGTPYTDMSTGTTMRNLVLVYQDTYVFGKGYMGAAQVEIPEKYLTKIGAPASETQAPVTETETVPEGASVEPTVAPAPADSSKAPIKIGEIATVTGDFAAYGVAEVESIKIAVKEINDAGGVLGRPLEVIMYDCRTRNEDMVNAARRLVQQDKVSAVIGPSGSGLCIAASPVFTEARVPHIGTLPTNPLVTVDESGKVKPYNFRICFLDPYQGRILAVFAAQNLNAKTAAVLYDVASDYSQGLREFFVKDFEASGGKIIADEGHRSDDVDFRAQLTKIKDTNPDILVLPTMGKVTPLAVKQAREMGITVPIIGGDGYGDFMWEITGQEAMKNTFWVSHVDKADPALADFFRKYEEATGAECQEFMNAVLAYDSVYWLKDAIERADGDDPEKIKEALETTNGLKLMHATITMDEFHNPEGKDGVILEAKDGKAVFLTKIRPEM
jgi:ABC-type branched-subunit amino acid transport system substrate-binding protein